MLDGEMQAVGEYKQRINDALGIGLPCGTIYCSNGLMKHILKRHPDCVEFYEKIPLVLSEPDMVGVDPTKPQSVEFIKHIDPYILVAVTLDVKAGYLYVSSMYDQTTDKVARRLNSGRYVRV